MRKDRNGHSNRGAIQNHFYAHINQFVKTYFRFHNLLSLPGIGPGRRVITLTHHKGKDIFLISKTFYTIFQKSLPGSTILVSQRTVPAANACSNAASVSAWRPNSNQCLYLARLAKTRQTPRASRAIYAFTLFIKTISASGPTNARSMRPIPFPYFAQYATRPRYASGTNDFGCVASSQRIARIPPPVRALFFANFRFAGISSRLGTTYPFFFLRRFTGFFGAFPGMVVFRGRPRLGFGCNISLTMFGTVSDFSALHQKNVAVPVL